MAEQFVGKASEIKDGERRIVFVGEHEIGVFKEKGEYYAYSNFCLHQGGPACEGLTIAKVEERIMPDKTSRGLYFSDTELHFVCPWHGMEYDMKTGECVAAIGLATEIERGLREGRFDTLTPQAFQVLMAALCKTYAAQSEGGEGFMPLADRNSVSPTEIMTTTSALLKSANLAVFELGMWQSWTGR